jgi:hypothetical protein
MLGRPDGKKRFGGNETRHLQSYLIGRLFFQNPRYQPQRYRFLRLDSPAGQK